MKQCAIKLDDKFRREVVKDKTCVTIEIRAFVDGEELTDSSQFDLIPLCKDVSSSSAYFDIVKEIQGQALSNALCILGVKTDEQ